MRVAGLFFQPQLLEATSQRIANCAENFKREQPVDLQGRKVAIDFPSATILKLDPHLCSQCPLSSLSPSSAHRSTTLQHRMKLALLVIITAAIGGAAEAAQSIDELVAEAADLVSVVGDVTEDANVSTSPCWQYENSDIGGGANLPFAPCAVNQISVAQCCACCHATAGCASWTLARNDASATTGKCWHHPAGSGIKRTPHANWTAGLCSSSEPTPPAPVESYDFLNLHNHAGPSGVPLGGIGVGFFSVTPQGRIGGVAINNWHQWGLIDEVDGSLLAGWSEDAGAKILNSDVPPPIGPLPHECAAPAPTPSPSRFGIPLASDTHATMLFPTANITIEDGNEYSIRAWSGLVPHNVKDSSLPLAWLEVTLHNPTTKSRAMAAAFAWQDVIARKMIDVTMEQINAFWPKAQHSADVNNKTTTPKEARLSVKKSWGVDGVDAAPRRRAPRDPPPQPPPPSYNGQGCGGEANTLYNALNSAGDHSYRNGIARRATFARAFNTSGLSGMLQRCDPILPVKATLQNYNNEIALLVDETTMRDGDELTFAPSFDALSGITAQGEDAWAAFRASGRLTVHAGEMASDVPLFVPPMSSTAAALEAASAVALRTVVPPMSSRIVRFAVAWHAPELIIDKTKDNRTRCAGAGADFGRFHHNFFSDDFGALLSYAASSRERIEAGTVEWMQPILRADSALPDWLKFKLINSAYTMFTNGILTRGGDFSALEGGMGGLGGTMDQRITAHPFYQKFFPALDNVELDQYGVSAIAVSGSDGDGSQIMHFDVDLYAGVVGTEPGSSMFRDWKLDTCGGWIWQIAKTMEQTANLTAAKRWWSSGGNASAGYAGLIPAVIAFMSSQVQSSDYVIPTGPNTFDDFWHPPLDSVRSDNICRDK